MGPTCASIAKQDMRGEVGDFLRVNPRDGDQIANADLLLPEQKPDRHAHSVRVRDGSAKIVGLLDIPIRE